MKKIVNIINFIRAVEPRAGRKIDLLEPVIRQMELAKKHQLPVTWLIQYDALIDPQFTDYLKANMDYRHEIGIWFEVVQPQAEKAGITWRGRYPWDWHVDKGFSVGYTQAERERLADVFMEEFVKVWGFYPDSAGSWFMDAHLLEYLHQRYGITASCNCKDQWGTDGYTLWGGYWANAYYPSRFNAYMPAQTIANQIPVPTFRMLGSDPIYQYNGTIGGNGQCVITLEPVSCGNDQWKYGGGDPAWTRWFIDTTFNSPCLSMSYAQAGQENSFGWPIMANAIIDQFPLIAERAAQGQFQVETLRTSARRFRNEHPLTPATAVTALNDWQKHDRASVWYLSRFQRINFFVDEHQLQIRDWQTFNELYSEPFLDKVCTSSACTYDALPLMDGLCWKGAAISLRQIKDGKKIPLPGVIFSVNEVDATTLSIIWQSEQGNIEFIAAEKELIVKFNQIQGIIEYRFDREQLPDTTIEITDDQNISFRHRDFAYALHCSCGTFKNDKDAIIMIPKNGKLTLSLE